MKIKVFSTKIGLRVFLMTLALGLAAIPFFNEVYKNLTEIPVDLPQINSESPIIISPKYGKEIPFGGGGGG